MGRRRVPRSRKEIRDAARPPSSAASSLPSQPAPPVVVVAAPPPHPLSGCLHSPYECSVYRHPPHWCSSCQVRAASYCAQNGLPDVRHLFHAAPLPACVEYGACAPPVVYRQAACPTTAVSCPSVSPACAAPAPLPSHCTLPPRSACAYP